MNIALIVFAGSGSRIKSDTPKQFIRINDQEMVVYAIKKFNENPHVDEIYLVTSKEYVPYVESLIDKHELHKVKKVVSGGNTRQDSVRLGLVNIECDKDDKVLIHDGDRPLVSNALINQAFDLLDDFDAVTPIFEEELNYEEISKSGRKIGIDGVVYDVQTPQGFKYGLIRENHINKAHDTFSDDISLVEKEVEVKYFPGEKDNFKVTLDQDLEHLKTLLEK